MYCIFKSTSVQLFTAMPPHTYKYLHYFITEFAWKIHELCAYRINQTDEFKWTVNWKLLKLFV
jgi:hypothetical protein